MENQQTGPRVIAQKAEPAPTFSQLSSRLEEWQIVEIAVVLHVVAFIFLALYISGDFNLDSTRLYLSYGQHFNQGLLPYLDFSFEYPPLALLLFSFPARAGDNIALYMALFAIEMLAFDLLGVWASFWAYKRLLPGHAPWGAILVQPILLVVAGRSIVTERFDLAPAVFTLVAIVLVCVDRRRLGWLTLGLATALKLYPIVLAPLFVLLIWKKGTYRSIRSLASELAIFAAAIVIPSLLVTRGDVLSISQFLFYHVDRGLEIESLYSSVLMLSGLLFHIPGFSHFFSFGSEELAGPATSLLASLSFPLTVAGLLGVYLLAWRTRRQEANSSETFKDLVMLSGAALIVFMILTKVLSPQYLLWLYPLAAVITFRRQTFWLLLGGALLAAMWVFPYHWSDLLNFEPLAVGILFLRNVILVAILFLLLQPSFARLRQPAGS